MVRRSSAVEQLTVNQLVVGSIPTAGAIFQNVNSTVKRIFNVFCFITKVIKSYKVFETVRLTVGKLEKSSLIHLKRLA